MANKKIIRLTEQDLERMVRRIIKEENHMDNDADMYVPKKGEKINSTIIETSNLVNQFYDLLEQDLGYSQEEVDEIFQEVGDEPEMIIEFLSDLLSVGHGQMIDKQIIDLMSKLAPMADAFRDDEDYMSSEEELINATYDLLYNLGYDHIEDDYIQSLEDARKALDTELYDNDHGSEMEEKIEALLNKIEEVIYYPDNDEGENIEDHLDYMSGEKDYMEQGFKKPGMFQKLKKQARNLVGVEYDRETLDQIYRMIKMGRVESIRKQNAGLTAWVNGKALIVDRLTPEIIYAGKTLDLVDTDLEVDNLYQKLILNL